MLEKEPERDEELLAQAREGNRGAFERMVERYRSKVFGTLVNLLGRYSEAEEAFWDVWAEVWSSLKRFRGESSLSTWIYSITTHVVYHRRRKRPAPQIPLEEVEDRATAQESPERDVVSREESRRLEKAMAALPENLRVPLVLHALADLSYQEISEVLNVPVGALKTRVWRAKLELRKVLESWKKAEQI